MSEQLKTILSVAECLKGKCQECISKLCVMKTIETSDGSFIQAKPTDSGDIDDGSSRIHISTASTGDFYCALPADAFNQDPDAQGTIGALHNYRLAQLAQEPKVGFRGNDEPTAVEIPQDDWHNEPTVEIPQSDDGPKGDN